MSEITKHFGWDEDLNYVLAINYNDRRYMCNRLYYSITAAVTRQKGKVAIAYKNDMATSESFRCKDMVSFTL
jgi:hypothetical protein